MKFKIDENLPLDAATILREAGFDVESVWDESLSGASDENLADRVLQEARVLITLDLDFANIRSYPPEKHPGIIVLRPRMQDKQSILAYIRKFVGILPVRNPAGELWIVQHDRIRVRSRG